LSARNFSTKGLSLRTRAKSKSLAAEIGVALKRGRRRLIRGGFDGETRRPTVER
jgi:hypothetical protein